MFVRTKIGLAGAIATAAGVWGAVQPRQTADLSMRLARQPGLRDGIATAEGVLGALLVAEDQAPVTGRVLGGILLADAAMNGLTPPSMYKRMIRWGSKRPGAWRAASAATAVAGAALAGVALRRSRAE